MKSHVQRERGTLADSAERQMKTWAMSLEVKRRVDRERAIAEVAKRTRPFLSVSRESGAGGTEVARRVAQILSWNFLDREILHYMAETYRTPETILEHVDETKANWIWDVFGGWLDRRLVSQTEYVTRLGRILILASRHASAVIVGRGAQFLLPRERGVAVRVVAPRSWRVERIMKLRNLSRDEAAAFVDKQDRDRDQFVKRYFHRDATNPELYDLVINTEFTSLEQAAELIVHLCRQRFGGES